MPLNIPPFSPTFGAGAPGAHVPVNQWYFNTTPTPYTLYIHVSGAWHAAGAIPAINATELQGVNVKLGTPSDGNELTYKLADLEWEGA